MYSSVRVSFAIELAGGGSVPFEIPFGTEEHMAITAVHAIMESDFKLASRGAYRAMRFDIVPPATGLFSRGEHVRSKFRYSNPREPSDIRKIVVTLHIDGAPDGYATIPLRFGVEKSEWIPIGPSVGRRRDAIVNQWTLDDVQGWNEMQSTGALVSSLSEENLARPQLQASIKRIHPDTYSWTSFRIILPSPLPFHVAP